MERCSDGCVWPFRAKIDRWHAVPGGIDTYGNPVTKPAELATAETIINLCERFGCLPSALYAEDAEIFRLIRLVDDERELTSE